MRNFYSFVCIKRADSFGLYNFGIIERILKSKTDFIPVEEDAKIPDEGSSMRLLGMHQAFKTSLEPASQMQTFTNEELVHHLMQSEWDYRQYRSVQRGFRNINFRYIASIEQLDYCASKELISEEKSFIKKLSKDDVEFLFS